MVECHCLFLTATRIKACAITVDNYAHAQGFVPDSYKTQKMCDKAVNTCPFIFDSVSDCYKTQEMSNKVISEEPFKLKYYYDKYKTQEMCDNV